MSERLPETVNWVRSAHFSRRQALGATAGAGFALAAGPVAASVITTDASGLDAAWTKVPAGDRTIAAYRARPADGRPRPVILVVQEIFGVHAWVQDIVRRLAHAGYYAIAPDLYARQGDPAAASDIKTLVETIVAKVPDDQVMRDLDATVAFAADDGGQATRLGITGFCWGGRITWLYAAHNPKLKAGVAWYGKLTGAADALHPSHPAELVGRLHAPVLGLYGALDRGIPLSDINLMRARLELAKSPSTITVYEGADHGFLADYRPSYNAAAAKAGWAAALDWFRQKL